MEKNKELEQKLLKRNEILIDALVRRAERDYPDGIAMIGVCGSFCNGDFHERSDLDLMILIDDPAVWGLAECFVIGEVGFDFYCTTWEALEGDSACNTPHLAKLLDTKIIYCKKPEAMERYEALRAKARAILDAPMSAADIERAEAEYTKAEKAYGKLMRIGESVFEARAAVTWLLYDLENAVCILNKTYFKQSTRRIFDEFAAMRYVPEDFSGLVHALTDAETVPEMQQAATKLLQAVDAVFEAARDALPKEEKEKPSAANLKGCLEEMISNFRGKMWNAAASGDSHAALSALGSLQSFFDDLAAGLDMPRYDALTGFEPKDLYRSIENYENALKAFGTEYEKAGMQLRYFDTPEAFAEAYLSEK